MRFLLGLIVGLFLGAFAVYYYRGNPNPAGAQTAGNPKAAAQSAAETFEDRLRNLKLRGPDITNELDRTGRVVRDKAAAMGHALADAAHDAKITAEIKAKYLKDPDLSPFSIGVSTAGGEVTLSGTAASADNIGKAVLLALDTDGVTNVVSTITVKP